MPATFRAAGSPVFTNATSTTVNATVPAGVVPSDYVVLAVTWVSNSVDAASFAGWTTLLAPQRPANSTTWVFALYGRTGLTAGDTITGTVGTTAARFTTLQPFAWQGGAEPTVGAVYSRPGGTAIGTCVAPSVTTTAANQTVAAFSFERTTAAPTLLNSVSPATQRGYSGESGNATCTIACADQLQVTAGAAPAVTFTYNHTHATNGVAVQLVIPTAGPPPPALTRPATQGLPETDTVRVTALTEETTSARLAVSTSSGMTSPVFGSSASPDGEGYVHLECSGLSPDTDYWWQVELDGDLVGDVGRTRTLPGEGEPVDFSFLAASCSFTSSNDTVFDAMRTRTSGGRRPLFFAHLGDIHYTWSASSGNPIAPADEGQHTTAYENGLSQTRQAALYRDVPLSHSWSDNDFCGSNSDGTYDAVATVQTMWRKVMSYPDLPDDDGIYRSWVVGRVRFIQTDNRSFMSDKGATDNSSKTMLGATQKAWFKDRLLDPEPVKIWLSDSKWTGTPGVGGGVDYWTAFNTERTELGNFIDSNNVNLLYVHGDTHSLAADDGSNNPYGGFPWANAAPMDQSAQTFPHTASEGSWPASGDTQNITRHAYGWFDVEDDGTEITVTFTGYDSGGTARITLEQSWDTSTPQSASDSATTTDAATLSAARPATDSASLTDSGVVALSRVDAAALTETAAAAAATAASDTATVTDTSALDGQVTGTDSAAAADVGVVGAVSAATDSATLADSSTLDTFDSLGVSDGGSVTDTASLAVVLGAAESASLAEAAAAAAEFSATDSAAADESSTVDVTVPRAGADSADFTEQPGSLAVAVSATDSAAVAEGTGTASAATDSATVSESATVTVSLGATDQGTATDSAAASAVVAAAEAIVLTELATLGVANAEFTCQVLAGTVDLVRHSGAVTVGGHSGTVEVAGHSGSVYVVRHAGSASICGR